MTKMTSSSTCSTDAEGGLSAQEVSDLATVSWEGTPASVESYREGKRLAALHRLNQSSFDKLVETVAAEPVPGQQKLALDENKFPEVALPPRSSTGN